MFRVSEKFWNVSFILHFQFRKRISNVFIESSSSLSDVDDIQERKAKRNYGQTGDLAYFEDALCGQEGPRDERERERDGLPSAKK